MHKKDYIAQVMAYYKQIESSDEQPGPGFEIRLREPDPSWKELVNRAAYQGLDNLEVNELIRMADYAKYVLK